MEGGALHVLLTDPERMLDVKLLHPIILTLPFPFILTRVIQL